MSLNNKDCLDYTLPMIFNAHQAIDYVEILMIVAPPKLLPAMKAERGKASAGAQKALFLPNNKQGIDFSFGMLFSSLETAQSINKVAGFKSFLR